MDPEEWATVLVLNDGTEVQASARLLITQLDMYATPLRLNKQPKVMPN